MAMNEVTIHVNADTKKAEKGFGRVEGALKQLRLPLLALGGSLAGLGFIGIKAASDLQESMNAVNVVFGEAADTIHAFGEDSARAVGLSTAAFNQLSAETGALLTSTGRPIEEMAQLTTDLAVRAADMASIFNTDVSEAMSAIQQAIRGETEAIRRFTGDVTDATLQQFLMARGIDQTVTEMTQQEKRLLRVQVIMAQTEKFAGDFARTSGDLANKMRIAKAQLTSVSAELGAFLIPLVTKAVSGISNLAGWFSALPTPVKGAAVAVGGIVAALALAGLALPPVIAGLSVLAGGIGLLLSPIGLVVVAIGAFALAWSQNWGNIRQITANVIQKVLDDISKWANRFIEAMNFVISGVNKVSSFLGTDPIPEIGEISLQFEDIKKGVAEFAVSAVSSIKGVAQNAIPSIDALIAKFNSMTGATLPSLSSVIDTVRSNISGLTNGLLDVGGAAQQGASLAVQSLKDIGAQADVTTEKVLRSFAAAAPRLSLGSLRSRMANPFAAARLNAAPAALQPLIGAFQTSEQAFLGRLGVPRESALRTDEERTLIQEVLRLIARIMEGAPLTRQVIEIDGKVIWEGAGNDAFVEEAVKSQ